MDGHAAVARQSLQAAESGLRLAPLSVQQADTPATAGDGLLRDWPRPAVDVQKHYGYAFQWFCLAALIAALYIGLSCKRGEDAAKQD